jgi:hypothetical protein
MAELEIELAALRARRRSPGFMAWVRSHRPFDRRAIREPDERDVYWVVVQQRLAESDAAFLMASRATHSTDSTGH